MNLTQVVYFVISITSKLQSFIDIVELSILFLVYS